MDFEFLDPLAREVPQVILNSLKQRNDEFYFTKCSFSSDGSYLALACSNGMVIVWDMLVNAALMCWKEHYPQCDIVALSWSASNRYLLSASTDWVCCIYDLTTGKVAGKVVADSVIECACMHPVSDFLFLLSTSSGPPRLCKINDTTEPSQLFLSLGSTAPISSVTIDCTGIYAVFGTLRGHVLIYSLISHKVVYQEKLTGASAIKQIKFSPSGHYMFFSMNDRIIRVCSWNVFSDIQDAVALANISPSLGPAPPESASYFHEDEWFEKPITLWHKLQDLVNRCSFTSCVFSSNSEYIAGGCSGSNADSVYIWQTLDGRLVKVLQGIHEGIEDLAWHPRMRGQLVTVTEMGQVLFWGTSRAENWSNYASDFEELYKNLEYDELEDELDIRPLEMIQQKTGQAPDSAILVDVLDTSGNDQNLEQINPNIIYSKSSVLYGDAKRTFYIPLKYMLQ